MRLASGHGGLFRLDVANSTALWRTLVVASVVALVAVVVFRPARAAVTAAS